MGEVGFRALGPLEVSRGNGPAIKLAPMRRRLLATLLARAGHQLSVDQLANALWEADPPPSATAGIHVHLHRLRRDLGESGHITRGAAGYQISVTAAEFDAKRFTDLAVRAARERAGGRTETAFDTVREALALWRGEPYGGVPRTGAVAAAAERLREQRLTAVQAMHELQLDLRRHHEAVAPLTDLAAAHPHNERFAALLMLALHRSGRRAEALELYRVRRRQTVERLGLEPGALLRRMHEAILRADDRLERVATASLERVWEPGALAPRPTAPVPRELPRPPHPFTGRDAELAALDDLAANAPAPLALITGMGGIGKTALAVHWGHDRADRFPDGQLYIDLRGHGPDPLPPIEALTAMLASLGVPAAQIPADLDRAGALFRTRTGDRRLLIVLDNAADAAQVRPLLPGGARTLTAVTSRHRLGSLVAWNGGTPIPVSPLGPEAAGDLLARLTELAPEQARSLAELCGFLPLALRIAAANLAESGDADLLAHHAAAGLDALQIDGDTVVRAVFDASYQAMPPEAQRLFRLFGTAPGTDLSAEAAAHLAGLPLEVAEATLDRLVSAHLVDPHRAGRYRLHDLLGLYAAERAAEDPEPERAQAIERLLTWCLRCAEACHERLYPSFFRLPAPEAPAPDDFDAQAWLDAEHANLVAAVLHAAEHGPRPLAWRLTDLLRGHFWLGVHGRDGERTARAALAAAEAEAHLPGQAVAELSLTSAFLRSGRSATAIGHGLRAAELAESAGLPTCRASAELLVAQVYADLGRLEEALVHGRTALRLHRELDHPEFQCTDLVELGVAHLHLGDLDAAVDHFEQALELAAATSRFTFEANVRAHLADALRLRGDLDQALAHLDEVLQADAARIGQRSSRNALAARVHLAAGDVERAFAHAAAALDGLDALSDRRLESSARSAMAAVRAARGEPAAAVADYDRALELVGRGAEYYRVEALCGRAAALAHLGDSGRAVVDASAALESARACGYRLLEARARDLLASA
ncbi:BTAD domain-containing putative transcriptional regulator [Glycomyces sp. NPDC046736]|uniref:AfsR/SARP family transcriptional regulator n=1 Tax=Glycomyces sp. NPDC046736 TaxID=3155615 RepID=UPI0033D94FD9